MEYVNYIYNNELIDTSAWNKRQLYREIKYHYISRKVPILNHVFASNLVKVDFEPTQNLKTYLYRFVGNFLSLFFD